MAVKSFLQWYGGNRMHARTVGQVLGKQDLIGVAFAGGLSELPYLSARQILINDIHSDLINLCRVLCDRESELIDRLNRCVFHPEELAAARDVLSRTDASDLDRAVATFVNNWMARCAGGAKNETTQPIATRFTASGGSSIARWRSAVNGLPEWASLLRSRCECTCLDWRTFAKKWQDRKGHALYLDPPWIDAGDEYKHKFMMEDHEDLAEWCHSLKLTFIVFRHSDHEFYRSQFSGWPKIPVESVNQNGDLTGEVLYVKTNSRVEKSC